MLSVVYIVSSLGSYAGCRYAKCRGAGLTERNGFIISQQRNEILYDSAKQTASPHLTISFEIKTLNIFNQMLDSRSVDKI